MNLLVGAACLLVILIYAIIGLIRKSEKTIVTLGVTLVSFIGALILSRVLSGVGSDLVMDVAVPKVMGNMGVSAASLQTGPHGTRRSVSKGMGADQLMPVMKAEFDPFCPQDQEACLSIYLSRYPPLYSIWSSVAEVSCHFTNTHVAASTGQSHREGTRRRWDDARTHKAHDCMFCH